MRPENHIEKAERRSCFFFRMGGYAAVGCIFALVAAVLAFPGPEIAAYLSRRLNRALPAVSLEITALHLTAKGLAADRLDLFWTKTPDRPLFQAQELRVRPSGLGGDFPLPRIDFEGRSGDGFFSGTIDPQSDKSVVNLEMKDCRIGLPMFPVQGVAPLVREAFLRMDIRGRFLEIPAFRAQLPQGWVEAEGDVDLGGNQRKDGRLNLRGRLDTGTRKIGDGGKVLFSVDGPLSRPRITIGSASLRKGDDWKP